MKIGVAVVAVLFLLSGCAHRLVKVATDPAQVAGTYELRTAGHKSLPALIARDTQDCSIFSDAGALDVLASGDWTAQLQFRRVCRGGASASETQTYNGSFSQLGYSYTGDLGWKGWRSTHGVIIEVRPRIENARAMRFDFYPKSTP